LSERFTAQEGASIHIVVQDSKATKVSKMSGFNGIPMRGINIPKTQTIGGSHVLPAGPYTPNLPQFDSVDISRDSLPAHNAKAALAGIHVRPLSPMPTVVVDHMAGAGSMPSPKTFTNMSNLPDVRTSAFRAESPIQAVNQNIESFDMRGQGLSPDEPISYRPAHTIEMYGSGSRLDVSMLDIARHEVMLDQLPTNHGVDAVYGGSPFSEKASISIRPQPANARGPQYRVPASVKREPIISVPLRPAPPRINMPRIPRVSASPVNMEVKPVLPPTMGSDMGIGAHANLLAGNSRNMGPLGPVLRG